MTTNFEITLPIPPSINHCYFYIGGKKVKAKDAREFDAKVIKLVQEEMSKQKVLQFKEQTKIRCNMKYYFPDNRRRDTHNTFKLLFDAIEKGGLYIDDRYVLPCVTDWEIDKANPRLELEFHLIKE